MSNNMRALDEKTPLIPIGRRDFIKHVLGLMSTMLISGCAATAPSAESTTSGRLPTPTIPSMPENTGEKLPTTPTGTCIRYSTPSFDESKVRPQEVDMNEVERVFKNLLRPMEIQGNSFPDDGKVIDLLQTWMKQIKLANKTYDIQLVKKNTYQGSSIAIGINTYLIHIDDVDLIRKIVIESENKSKEVIDDIGEAIANLEYVGGILVLNRGISFASGEGSAVPMELAEWYHFDVYVKNCGFTMPLFQIYHDSLGFWRTQSEYWTSSRYHEESVGSRFFPTANLVFMNWHRFAKTYGLTNRLEYIRAKAESLAASDHNIAGIHSFAMGFFGRPELHRMIYRRSMPGEDWREKIERYEIWDSEDPTRDFSPPFVANIYSDPNGSPPLPDLPGVFEGFPQIDACCNVILPDIPEKSFPDNSAEAYLFEKLLFEQYNGAARYFGNDLIAVQIDGMYQSAILHGTRQSPPRITVDGNVSPGSDVTGVLEYAVGDWAGDLLANDRYYSEERIDLRAQIPRWGRACACGYDMDYADCKTCVLKGPAGEELGNMRTDMGLDILLDSIAGGIQGCGLLFLFGGGPWGCLIGAIAGSTVSIVQSYTENSRKIGQAKEEYFSYCESAGQGLPCPGDTN